jgi:hypothetical protein
VAPQSGPQIVITHGYVSSQWMRQRSATGRDPDAHVETAP